MLHQILFQKKNEWLKSPDCGVKDLVQYIRTKNELRDTQIEAIETYLFLKIKGENKPLWQLFSEGFFSESIDLEELPLKPKSRQALENNPTARALYSFAIKKIDAGGTVQLPEIKKAIEENATALDYQKIIKDIFYGIDYTDYLFSLPMGAGKTFLMASFIYLDLYFAQNEPENPHFAHNFLILIPSGLKSSIIPSLKSIERFNPAWVLPEPSASNLKRLIKFEVLDQPKTAKKSNKVQNPNSQKVNQYINSLDLMGLILVVNAEKVILDRLEIKNQLEVIERTADEKDKSANELRNLIGKIPNLAIHIDEVHHAANDDIKLRQVVSNWNKNGSVTTVLGFSGTPYLSSPEKIDVAPSLSVRFSQITNTVYYYRLVTAIQKFLKKPQIRIGGGRQAPMRVIEDGIKEFYERYGYTIYQNGTTAKIAIYCSSIERLEEEIYPFLVGQLNIPKNDVLKYHKGNKKYKIDKEAELEFSSLDLSFSKKKVILLVQVGKEGWDCRSLTGVILAQTGDCPTNMVLQTACRCLRQVVKGANETALIWLNEANAIILNKQLHEEQQTTIQELNRLRGADKPMMVDRISRIEQLKVPKIDFYQLKVKFTTQTIEETPNTLQKLENLFQNIDALKETYSIVTANLLEDTEGSHLEETDKSFKTEQGNIQITFHQWLLALIRESFKTLDWSSLVAQQAILQQIFDKITFQVKGYQFFNELYPIGKINASVRMAFAQKRDFNTETETIQDHAELLLVDKLHAVERNSKLYPTDEFILRIKDLDSQNADVNLLEKQAEELNRKIQEMIAQMGNPDLFTMAEIPPQAQPLPLPVKYKNKTFHYLPYNFEQSDFELRFLEDTLKLTVFQQKGLEVFYNGERGLTHFVIECYQQKGKQWKRLGQYTPDFLILHRTSENTIHKVLIVETKGEGFKTAFLSKKDFMSNFFIKQNNEKFGYHRFEFLYLQDDDSQAIAKLNQKIIDFFH